MSFINANFEQAAYVATLPPKQNPCAVAAPPELPTTDADILMAAAFKPGSGHNVPATCTPPPDVVLFKESASFTYRGPYNVIYIAPAKTVDLFPADAQRDPMKDHGPIPKIKRLHKGKGHHQEPPPSGLKWVLTPDGSHIDATGGVYEINKVLKKVGFEMPLGVSISEDGHIDVTSKFLKDAKDNLENAGDKLGLRPFFKWTVSPFPADP